MASLTECQHLRRCASLQHTLALPSPKAPNQNYFRMAFVHKFHKINTPGLMACASPMRILALGSSQACHDVQQKLSLKITFASPPQHTCAEFGLPIAPATCAFTLRLSRTYPHAASSTLTLLTSWRLRTAFIISTFTLRLAATYSRVYITHINALAHCLSHMHLHTPLHYHLPAH